MLKAALMHAVRAMEEGTNISHSLEMEALSLSRPVPASAAWRWDLGSTEGMNRGYLCICPESEAAWASLNHVVLESDENWEEIPPSKQVLLMELFDITSEEIRSPVWNV